jgi:hypothetical protein
MNTPNKLLIVTAVCQTDYPLALKRANWMIEMGQKSTHALVLVNDGTVPEKEQNELAQLQTQVFESVLVRKITPPASPIWPASVNHVWRTITRNLIGPNPWIDKSLYQGWFFFEPDVTPLVSTWADVLDVQYAFHKKPFMGVKSIVHAKRGNDPVTLTCMNGAGCYPFDPQHFSAVMMLADGAPWDVLGLSEVPYKIAFIPDDAYLLTYGVTHCVADYVGAGEMTIKATKTVQDGTVTQISFVLKDQLLHHGCKDGSLIDLLEKAKEVKTKRVEATIPERLLPSLRKARSKKRVKQSKERCAANKEDILRDHAAGLGWSSLLGKYRVNPKHLKAIISEGACAPA